jgi:cell division protein FtsW (lipid II flippase)
VLYIILAGLAFVIIWILLNLASKINFQSPGILGIILSLFIVFPTLDMESVGANMWIYPAPLATLQGID